VVEKVNGGDRVLMVVPLDECPCSAANIKNRIFPAVQASRCEQLVAALASPLDERPVG